MSDEEFRNHACILPVIILKQVKQLAPLHAFMIAPTQFILYVRHYFFRLSLQKFSLYPSTLIIDQMTTVLVISGMGYRLQLHPEVELVFAVEFSYLITMASFLFIQLHVQFKYSIKTHCTTHECKCIQSRTKSSTSQGWECSYLFVGRQDLIYGIWWMKLYDHKDD